jgi:hypothetical protein
LGATGKKTNGIFFSMFMNTINLNGNLNEFRRRIDEYLATRTRLQAYQFELCVNEKQTHQMLRFAGACRLVFNRALAFEQRSMTCAASVLVSRLFWGALFRWMQSFRETALLWNCISWANQHLVTALFSARRTESTN